MGFLKNLFNKFMSFLKAVYRRKLIFYSILGILVAAVLVFFVFPIFGIFEGKVQKVSEEKKEIVIRDFFITIPTGAFSHDKSFIITPVTGQELEELRASYGFIKNLNIYNVLPSDGRKEFAYIPLKIKMYFPIEYFQGDEYVNLSLAYVEGGGPPNLFPGSYIGKDENGRYYIEASAFHASKIGVVALPARKDKHGLELVREVLTAKPALIIVPGEDPKFSGELGEENFWEKEFPDRTIYVFKYPLVNARSLNYMREAKAFFDKTGNKSFIEFEAEKLAEELINPEISRKTVHIIAHGVGGIIARLALENHPEITNVRKVVLVSVPSKGTNIANPLYFANFIYNTNPETAANLLGLSKITFSNVKLHIFNFIESVNDYYKDLLPDSDVIKKLSKESIRKDLKYLSIVGIDPPFDIDVSGSDLAKIYPELVKGNGDGVVSVESAKIEGVPLLKFPGSFDSYYTRADVIGAIKAFIDTDKVEEPPELESDKYREYAPIEVVKREGLPEKQQPTKERREVKKAAPSYYEFMEPTDGFVQESVLMEETSFSLNVLGYDSGGCVIDEPYFATTEGIFKAANIFEKGSFSYMKGVSSVLTAVKNKNIICQINPVGYKELGAANGIITANITDIFITPKGKIYSTMVSQSGDVIKLMVYEDGEYKIVEKAQGTYGRLIPLEDGSFLFLTNKMVMLLNEDGNVLEKISISTMVKERYGVNATYAYKIGNIYFIITEDHYLIVYDDKNGRSWILGKGWTGSLKILYLKSQNILIILGKKLVNFVDLESREMVKYVNPLGYEALDGFVCSGKIYIIGKEDYGYRVHVYTIGPGML